MPGVTYGRALYYPYIRFADQNWLKTAALYYDGISRIVPQSARPESESFAVALLRDELDFIADLDPTREAHEIAYEFLKFSRKRNVVPEPLRVSSGDLRGMEPHRLGGFHVYREKFASTTLHALAEMGLVNSARSDAKRVALEPWVAAVYLTFLAERMAERRKVPVVTDDPRFDSLLRKFQFESTDPRPDHEGDVDAAFALAAVVIKSVIPQRLDDIPLKRIVQFRKKHEDERHRFFEAVRGISKDIPKIQDIRSLEECLNHHRKTIEQAVEDLGRSLEGMKIRGAAGLMALSAPPWLAAAGFNLAAAPVVVAAGVSLFAGVKLGEYYQEYHRVRKGSPWGYVLSLRRGLRPANFIDRLLG